MVDFYKQYNFSNTENYYHLFLGTISKAYMLSSEGLDQIQTIDYDYDCSEVTWPCT